MDAGRYCYGSTDLETGIWTHLEFNDDSVIARPTEAYARGHWAGLAFYLIVGAMFLRASVGANRPWNLIAGALVVVFFGYRIVRSIRRNLLTRRRPFVVIYDASSKASIEDAVEQIPMSAVEAVRLCDNAERTRPSEQAFWQTYLHVRGRAYAVLVHQRIKWNREKELAVATRLAERLGVPLIDG